MAVIHSLPRQKLSFSRKNLKWRKQHLDWASSMSVANSDMIRSSVAHKKINYDLLNGILHMEDLERILNPYSQKTSLIPDSIPHYPIMNSKLNVLRGEESKRVFDYRLVITNPNAVSQMAEEKRKVAYELLMQMMQDENLQQESQVNRRLDEISKYMKFEWKDMREVRANYLLNHYYKEQNFPITFNDGFVDAMAVAEELYSFDIVGGEPIMERVNPIRLHAYMSGYSNRVEDAQIIVMEDFWSPSKVLDRYGDQLKPKDVDYIERIATKQFSGDADGMDNIDESKGFIYNHMVDDTFGDEFYFDAGGLFGAPLSDASLPYDFNGNVRVIQMRWKSFRAVKFVKSYNAETGEADYGFYPETYKCREELGETEEIRWINEAWEGTLIGKDVYVNMRPRLVQYNKMSNPSFCSLGIVGTVYNLNESRPFSLVDMMKQYNYLYDFIHYRLDHIIARNWGKIVRLDLAKVPKGWQVEKWMYYAQVNGLAVEDSFKQGNSGIATGKLAGAMNNASSGVIDAEYGNSIQMYMNLLEYIKGDMGEVAGISRQREGQIANRETVGGVERSNLQSSYITEWLFLQHDDVKKRAIEMFIETTKIALKGRSKKFKYLLPDGAEVLMEIDGDEFAESDYGLIVDSGNGMQELRSNLDRLAQAALQNQVLDFSTLTKIYSSVSLAEKQRMIEEGEENMRRLAEEQQQQQAELAQQKMQMDAQQNEAKMQQEDMLNKRDNDTRIQVAEINAVAEAQRFAMMNHDFEDGIDSPKNAMEMEKLKEQIREFDAKMKLDREKLALDRKKASQTKTPSK